MPTRARGGSRAAKISITVDPQLLRDVRRLVRRSGATLSGHIGETLAADLRRRKLTELVAAYEAEHGDITEEELTGIRRAMKKR